MSEIVALSWRNTEDCRKSERKKMKEKRKLALLCGLLGCLCYGGGD
jgi:hypothetical protein